MIDIVKAQEHIDQCWGDEIVPTLAEYIKIPNSARPAGSRGCRSLAALFGHGEVSRPPMFPTRRI